ncbi:MAG: PLD nuclease N-terminal domain-containing protein [Nitrospirae bacterium]|nr:PLD nuclease N-terminal domain-containing protein [Nitrospirota bacterium]
MIGVFELFILLALFGLLPFIIAFVDILRSDFKGNNKIVWLLAVIFVPWIGAIAYFIIGRKQKVKK